MLIEVFLLEYHSVKYQCTIHIYNSGLQNRIEVGVGVSKSFADFDSG